jgi:hypothetical protein
LQSRSALAKKKKKEKKKNSEIAHSFYSLYAKQYVCDHVSTFTLAIRELITLSGAHSQQIQCSFLFSSDFLGPSGFSFSL